MGKHTKNVKIDFRKILLIILTIILIACIIYLAIHFYNEAKNKNVMDTIAKEMNEAIATNSDTEIFNKMQEFKGQNSDFIGWLKIEDTNINYPVMQTDNNDYYLDKNFKKEYTIAGSLFLDKDCSLTKPTSNFLIYGHRNKNGEMFETLTKYKQKDFYENHKTFEFITLDEINTYKVIAVFQSQIFYKNQNVFKYYFFRDANNEQEFNNYIENIKKLSMYEIEDTAIYGEQLITLSTCDYHTEDGRFVVVAKKIQ